MKMKMINSIYKVSLPILISLLVIGLSAQSLPDETIISPDGRRLIQASKEVDGLYNDKIIRRIDISFEQTNWKNLLTQNYQSKTDLPATLIMDGKIYPNVGVRYKGQTSYQRVTTDKKSFNITMDLVDPKQDIKGYSTLNFNNSYEDNSFMREVFYENITRKHCPSLKATFINLYINGENYGLYPHLQALDGTYIKEWFLSNDGIRWRCERAGGAGGGPGPPGQGGGFGAGTSSLNYLGEDTSTYKPNYTLKHSGMNNPWSYLLRSTRALANQSNIDSLNKALDIDRTLWFLAKEILFGDDDSYVNKGGMDYYAYYDKETNRLIPLEYDANSVMEGPTSTWDLFFKESNAQFPLCNKLFKLPELRQRYLAHVRTMAQDLFNESTYTSLIDRYFNLIDTVVQKDTKKLMSYTQFNGEKETLKNWMKTRRNFILNHTEVNRIGPSITDVHYQSNAVVFKTPDAGQPVYIQAKVGNKKIKSVQVYYGTGFDGPFSRMIMSDDGNHQDGLANDGIYGASLPGQLAGVFVRYYIEAIADDGFGTVSYEPQGAEHDVYLYRVNLESSAITDVVINEVMTANTLSAKDQDNEFDDWIELYNNSTNTVDISRWILTDNPDNLDKYRIPNGTKLAAKSYLIIWADEDGKQAGYHANFKLSASGEPLTLLDSTGKQIDFVQIPALNDDIAYARQPNGTGSFVVKAHTFNKNNDILSPSHEIDIIKGIKIYPNPAHDRITIDLQSNKPEIISIFNASGQVMYRHTIQKESIPIHDWPPGVYIMHAGYQIQKFIIL
jgi:spore coat protein CotH